MKNKRKEKDMQVNHESSLFHQCVGVEGKKDVILIRYNVNSLTENEAKQLLQRTSQENLSFKQMYYGKNTPVKKIQNRTFWDLLKRFFDVYQIDTYFSK